MLVQGASGGVATALIQLGSAAGFRVWVTSRSPQKLAFATNLGAQRTFAAGEKLPEQVDAAFDLAGAATWKHSVESVRAGGTIVTCGVHGGLEVDAGLMRIFVDQITVRGVYAGTLREMKDLGSFVMSKGSKPAITEVLSLNEAPEGLGRLLRGETEGKIVIKIGE